MNIRHTTLDDLPTVMAIYARARNFMAATGNPMQWGTTNWSPEDLIRSDIAAEKSFVCVDGGEVVGTFFYDYGADVEPVYRKIFDGAWKNFSPYGVVHRLASSGTVQGIGEFCLTQTFEWSGHLRVDTHSDNKIVQHLLTKFGFEHCGTIFVVEDNFPRRAYEKF